MNALRSCADNSPRGHDNVNGPTVVVPFEAAPALVAGTTIVMKSSEKSPLSTTYFGKIFNEASFPPVVFNVVNGAGTTGALLSGVSTTFSGGLYKLSTSVM